MPHAIAEQRAVELKLRIEPEECVEVHLTLARLSTDLLDHPGNGRFLELRVHATQEVANGAGGGRTQRRTLAFVLIQLDLRKLTSQRLDNANQLPDRFFERDIDRPALLGPIFGIKSADGES